MVLAATSARAPSSWGGPYADTSMATAAFWVGVAAIVIGGLSLVASAASIILDLA